RGLETVAARGPVNRIRGGHLGARREDECRMVSEHPRDPGEQARDIAPRHVEEEDEIAEHRGVGQGRRGVAADLVEEAARYPIVWQRVEPFPLCDEDLAHLCSRSPD